MEAASSERMAVMAMGAIVIRALARAAPALAGLKTSPVPSSLRLPAISSVPVLIATEPKNQSSIAATMRSMAATRSVLLAT